MLAIGHALTGCGRGAPTSPSAQVEWVHTSGDPSGAKYSPVAQIDRHNVGRLELVWSVRAGDFPPDVFGPGHRAGARREDGSRVPPQRGASCRGCHRLQARFETTPLMRDGTLYVSTPLNRVLALDAATGARRWTFDPKVVRTRRYVEGLISRGVSLWTDSTAPSGAACRDRIFLATIDARLIALDATSGSPCRDFGHGGTVRLDIDGADHWEYSVTSPPTVVRDVLVVGSAIDVNRRPAGKSGLVRAFDLRTGAPRWSFDPLLPKNGQSGPKSRTGDSALETSGGNVWSIMSADSERDLIFLPTASGGPNFYGGQRPGRNDFANSVVALRASTGKVMWSYQVVHHDLWDYDVAAQPLLLNFRQGGLETPAVAVGTKMGMIFVLHRETGRPLFRVEERQTPQTDVQGEATWPTQPFALQGLSFHGTRLTSDSAFGVDEVSRRSCQALIARLRNEGLFTPPSLRGTLLWPGVWGGINWDGMAWDPERQIIVTTLRRLAMFVQLHHRDGSKTVRSIQQPGLEFLAQEGTPYSATRGPLVSQSGVPCSPPPWSLLVAIDLAKASVRWQRPLGIVPELRHLPGSDTWGSLVFGGPLLTKGGLVFIAASQDDRLRAFDIDTGDSLWEYELPAGGQASPMTYVHKGRQYVVIVAGGRAGIGSPGDWIIAFALPEQERGDF